MLARGWLISRIPRKRNLDSSQIFSRNSSTQTESFVRTFTSSVKSFASDRPNYILVTFDSFGTLIRPKEKIAKTYLSVARASGVKKVHKIDEEEFFNSFKSAFKEASVKHPNYGSYTSSMTPRDWWKGVVEKTFDPFIPLPTNLDPEKPPKHQNQQIDAARRQNNGERLAWTIDRLWRRYQGSQYTLFDDARPILIGGKSLKVSFKAFNAETPRIPLIIGVVTNADDRMFSVLRYLKLESRFAEDLSPRMITNESADAVIDPKIQDGRIPELDFVLTSYRARSEKPGQEIFRQAALLAERAYQLQYGSAASESRSQPGEDALHAHCYRVHVGDDPKTDVKGAREAGWDAILLRRPRSKGADYNWRFEEGQEKDTPQIENLTELRRVIEERLLNKYTVSQD
ncbi:MAG: hypothetical protein Q9227_001298 [Pyrenula ochraceoflavens]